MSAAAASRSNKLGVGYPARWVFGGREGRGLGKFARRIGDQVDPPAMRSGRSGQGIRRSIAGAVGSVELAASHPFTDWAGCAVAQSPSHGRAGMADFRRFRGPCRLIANLRTAQLQRLDPGQLGALAEADRAGGLPPFELARIPYAPGARRGGDLQNPPDRRRGSPAGCSSETVSRVPNSPSTRMGSGVRAAQRRSASGGYERAERAVGQNRVGVSAGAHSAFDPGKSGKLGAGAR